MKFVWILLFCVITSYSAYPQEEQPTPAESGSLFERTRRAIKNNEWEKDWWDLRLLDIPRVGILYDLEEGNTLLFRVSLPMTFPVMLSPPIDYTYGSSYWGLDLSLADITLGIRTEELLSLTPSNQYLIRLFPVSLWGGIPLSSRGIGLYLLFECAPLSLFTNRIDNYSSLRLGIGINTGLKIIATEYYEIDLRYENYFAYNELKAHNSCVGIYFNYRLFGAGYYVYYSMD
jgi:hypothetical protein